jgi:hypothetical protein
MTINKVDNVSSLDGVSLMDSPSGLLFEFRRFAKTFDLEIFLPCSEVSS